MHACSSGALRAAAAPALGLLAPGQPPSAGGRRRPTSDPHLPRGLAASLRMMELVVAAGADTGAGPVYAAGSDEGLGAFLIFPSAGISSNDALRKGVACFIGRTEAVKSLRQRLQRGRLLFSSCSNMLTRGAWGGQEHMLSSPPTPRGCMSTPLPFLLAVWQVRPPWPHCSPTPAAMWCSWWTKKFFVAASFIRVHHLY